MRRHYFSISEREIMRSFVQQDSLTPKQTRNASRHMLSPPLPHENESTSRRCLSAADGVHSAPPVRNESGLAVVDTVHYQYPAPPPSLTHSYRVAARQAAHIAHESYTRGCHAAIAMNRNHVDDP